MVRAFSGYLATDQLLLLWDRILGYNSLEILAGNIELFLQNMLSPGGYICCSLNAESKLHTCQSITFRKLELHKYSISSKIWEVFYR